MATTTETTERESKLAQLRRLESESRGEWVRCICTSVDEDDLVFCFETVHGRTETKNFDVPEVLVDSDVKAFLDDVGYSPENASLMEGDEFWMHMDGRRIADSTPPRWRKYKPTLAERPWLMEDSLRVIALFPIFGVIAVGFFILGEDLLSEVRGFATAILGLLVWTLGPLFLYWLLF